MPSRIDWKKYLANLQNRHTEYSTENEDDKMQTDDVESQDRSYEYIFISIECLAKLQEFLFDLKVPRCLLTLLRKDMLSKLNSIKVLRLLKDSMTGEPKTEKVKCISQTRISTAICWLEHILYHQLKYSERFIDRALPELNSTTPNLEEKESLVKQLKLRRWYDLSGLRPVLKGSVHDVGCYYTSQEYFEELFYPPDQENTLPEQDAIGDGNTEVMVCDYCQSSMEKNRYGQREELLVCKDCGNKAHPSCLSYSAELVEQIRADDSWQCIDCKACVICEGTGDPDTLLFCDACDKGYHMDCHTPKLEQMPSGKWACSSCLSKGKSLSLPGPQQSVYIIDEDELPPTKVNTEHLPPPSPVAPAAATLPPVTTVAMERPVERPIEIPVERPLQRSVEKLPNVNRSPITKAEQSLSVKANKSPAPVMRQPVMSVHQAGIIYPPAGSMAFGQMPVSAAHPVTFAQQPPQVHGHPVPIQIPVNQPHLIPVNYAMLPNGAQPPPPQAVTPQQSVLGKGSHNDLMHILNPKQPLPDVRSSIREDVLRSLPPDVADWTVQDVAYYFKAHGYIQESKLLEEQEIDGRAMLLMSRNDCLTGLRIKLGPALKIYHMHIHKLQKRTDFLG